MVNGDLSVLFSSQIDLHRDAVDHVALRLDCRLLHRRPSRGSV